MPRCISPGVDIYRVSSGAGSGLYGPYDSQRTASWVKTYVQRSQGGAPDLKVQKLVPVQKMDYRDCLGDCDHDHGWTLGWEDI